MTPRQAGLAAVGTFVWAVSSVIAGALAGAEARVMFRDFLGVIAQGFGLWAIVAVGEWLFEFRDDLHVSESLRRRLDGDPR